MVDLIWNERVRSTAAFCNTIAAAIVTVGVLTPLAVRYYTNVQPPPNTLEILSAMPYICIGAAAALYLLGLTILGLMDDQQ
jgi:hypothetical protein